MARANLYVEGTDDHHVIGHLLNRHGDTPGQAPTADGLGETGGRPA